MLGQTPSLVLAWYIPEKGLGERRGSRIDQARPEAIS